MKLLSWFLGRFEWFRRWHGGKWMLVYVDYPVCAELWLSVPADATPEYREGLWRGTPIFRDYDAAQSVRSEGDSDGR